MKQGTLCVSIAILAMMFLSGCVSLSRTEEATLSELRSYGVSDTEVKEKNGGTAGALNILPGFGNFYLAAGTDEGEQWAYGFLNLLTWPASVLWGIPEAAIDANTMNKKATVNYYTFDQKGKQEFTQLREQQQSATNAPQQAASTAQPAAK